MSGPEVVGEVAALAASTWDNKVLNIDRILQENGYKGAFYLNRLTDDVLQVIFPATEAYQERSFDVILPMVDSERQVLRIVDDALGDYYHDRVHEGEGGYGDG